MPTRTLKPIVVAIVQPVTKRLSRMEDLLVEMRHEQDVHLKQFNRLKDRIDTLTETIDGKARSKSGKKASTRR